MRHIVIVLCFVIIGILPVIGQSDTETETPPQPTIAITADSVFNIDWVRLEIKQNVFGELQKVVRGQLSNPHDDSAFRNISLFALAYDETGETVAEGFGYPVTICGFAPLDFTLPPSGKQYFDIPLELYEDGVTIASLSIRAVGDLPQLDRGETYPVPRSPIPHITQISDDEVVSVEFSRDGDMRYGIGCYRDVFATWRWYDYDSETGTSEAIEHPGISQVTMQARQRMRLQDDAEFNHSFTAISPTSRRLIFQSGVNHFYVAQPDGNNRRFVHQDLSRFSLQGIIWTTETDAFLAYYFGAYGEMVRYFTARTTGEWISRNVYLGTLSYTVPGPNAHGTEVIISTDELGAMGYYVKHTFLTANRLLFETDPPGNNYPAPVWIQRRGIDRAYIALVVDDVPTLQCYNLRTETLTTLTPLPLRLTENDRAWMWLSPDDETLFISQDGIEGGLWQVNLTELPECE